MKHEIETKKMMATIGYHNLGDISRDQEDYCFVNSEDDNFYYGSWCEGFGFVNVQFPKETTRDLTEAEIEYISSRRLVIV